MRMIIVRHGESEWNRIHRYQGQMDSALSELGKQQAEALAVRLKDEQLACIYTSRLQRASVTAEAIARYHPDVPFVQDDALLEIHHGEWQGKYAAEVQAAFAAELEEWRWHPMRTQMPDGESFSNVLKRSLEFKERTIAAHAGATIVASTHDVVAKILVADAISMDMNRINCIWIANASISIIDYSGALPFLLSLGDASHLGQLATSKESQKAL